MGGTAGDAAWLVPGVRWRQVRVHYSSGSLRMQGHLRKRFRLATRWTPWFAVLAAACGCRSGWGVSSKSRAQRRGCLNVRRFASGAVVVPSRSPVPPGGGTGLSNSQAPRTGLNRLKASLEGSCLSGKPLYGATVPKMTKGRPCGPTSTSGAQVTPPSRDCMAFPVVVWPRIVQGLAHGPELSEPSLCQSSQ